MSKFKRLLSLAMVLAMLLSVVAVPASAISISNKPQNGKTGNAPFSKGTGGSNSFRIPALVTLSDGTIVAAADARWNTTYDGGGLDTIVSRSYDNGATWNYSFANYLGDNGNTYSGSGSTAFIDPALAVTADDTIYMLVDLYPYGVALNGSGNTAPSTKVGFDSQGRLLLSSNNHSSYGYYLQDGKIYSSRGSVVSGYTVDEYFNITSTDGTKSNLFFSDSPYKVVRTGFLYLTKSTDGGATWSAPQLLNLKKSSEMVCLVAPGRGLVTNNGTIIFPVYSYHGDNSPSGNTQRMSFVYSTDGVNWNRTGEFNYNWASESAVVELEDGTLRFFFRNGTTNLCYVDYNMSSGSWGSMVNTGLDTNSNCQISAIIYSRKVDGKQVILVSCPTGPSEAGSNQSGASYRLNGKIFVGLVNENKTVSWQNAVRVTSNNSQFMYSCLTELKDGSVAILYENLENGWGTGNSCYYTMAYKTYSPDDLGLTFECQHAYGKEVVDATCTEDGYILYTCSICTDTYAEEIPAQGHRNTVVTKEATCTAAGSVTTTCTVCKESSVQAIPALGHQYSITVVKATCVDDGYTIHSCKNCGHSYEDQKVAALGHDYESTVVKPTCTEAGSTTYTCTACGHSYTGEKVAALGHDYDSVVTEPTFEKEGYTTHTCRTCGDVKVDSFVPVLTHTYEVETVDATCTENGSVTYTCVDCGYSYTETLPALGHSFETVKTAATCTEDGSIVSACGVCGHTETETVPATGHSYKKTTVPATCTENGLITYTCACGHETGEEIPAAGHSYKTSYTAPTCTEEGNTTHTCAACGDKEIEVIAALGHDYSTHIVAATCTEEGYTAHTCSVCGDSYVTDKVAALGHAYESAVTAATCTEKGYTTHICGNCGDSYADSYVQALGHSYECEESDGYLVYTCVCGDTYSEKIDTFTYTRVSSIKSGENYVITLYSGSRYYALSHADNKISVVQVSVSNKQITSEITEDMVWTYSNRRLSYQDGNKTYNLYAKTGSGWNRTTTLTLSTSNYTSVSFSNSKLKLGSYYLRYSNGSVSLNRSATTTYFFVEE